MNRKKVYLLIDVATRSVLSSIVITIVIATDIINIIIINIDSTGITLVIVIVSSLPV
jgi:hypothetical protein